MQMTKRIFYAAILVFGYMFIWDAVLPDLAGRIREAGGIGADTTGTGLLFLFLLTLPIWLAGLYGVYHFVRSLLDK